MNDEYGIPSDTPKRAKLHTVSGSRHACAGGVYSSAMAKHTDPAKDWQNLQRYVRHLFHKWYRNGAGGTLGEYAWMTGISEGHVSNVLNKDPGPDKLPGYEVITGVLYAENIPWEKAIVEAREWAETQEPIRRPMLSALRVVLKNAVRTGLSDKARASVISELDNPITTIWSSERWGEVINEAMKNRRRATDSGRATEHETALSFGDAIPKRFQDPLSLHASRDDSSTDPQEQGPWHSKSTERKRKR